MAKYGIKSKSVVLTCCPEIQAVANTVIKTYDHSAIEGARTKEVQDRYFRSRPQVSHLQWPRSKHNVTEDQPLSDAIDVWPYTKRWGALSGHPSQIASIAKDVGKSEQVVKTAVYESFSFLAGQFLAVATEMGYTFRWGGGDWDGDGDLFDQNFHDLPHIEIVR